MKCLCKHPQAADFGLFMLRLTLGAVLIYAGWGKLGDMTMTTAMFIDMGIPLAALSAWVVALVEFVGGIALIAGIWVHTFALLAAIVMLVALLAVHLGGPFPEAFPALLILGGALALHGTGAGKWKLGNMDCFCQAKKEKK